MPLKRSNGKWQARIEAPLGLTQLYVESKHRFYKVDRNGYIRVSGYGTRKDAERAEQTLKDLAAEQERRLRNGEPVVPKTFGEVAAEYLESLRVKDTNPSTFASYEGTLRLHLLPHFGATKIAGIWAGDVDDYLLTKADYAPASRDVHVSVLQCVFKYAHRRKWVLAVPPMTRSKAKERPVKKDDYWTDEEVGRVLAVLHTEPILKSYLPLGLYTGMRPSELYGLKWPEVRFAEDKIRVIQQRVKAHHVRAPKGGFFRTIEMTPDARDLLLELQAGAKTSSGHVLQYRGKPLHYQAVRTALDRLILKAEVRRITPHKLRDTFSAWFLSHSGEIPALSEQLGHQSWTVTQRHYAHHSRERAQRVVRQIPRLSNTVSTHTPELQDASSRNQKGK